MELDLKKKSKSDRMISLKNFAMLEVREIGEKKQKCREAFPSHGWE